WGARARWQHAPLDGRPDSFCGRPAPRARHGGSRGLSRLACRGLSPEQQPLPLDRGHFQERAWTFPVRPPDHHHQGALSSSPHHHHHRVPPVFAAAVPPPHCLPCSTGGCPGGARPGPRSGGSGEGCSRSRCSCTPRCTRRAGCRCARSRNPLDFWVGR
ncbi:hypothetical protein T484DRAFT_1913544, partial [Baffinella frigidus]